MTEPDDANPDEPSPRSPEDTDPRVFFHTAAVFYLVLAVVAVIWLGFEHGVVSHTLFLDPASIVVDLGIGLAVGLGIVGAWMVVRRVVPGATALEEQFRSLLGVIDRGQALVLALLSGFAEELFFRGAVQGSFGWIWATLIFAGMHVGPDRSYRLWTAFALVAGLIFAGLVELRGTLLAAIVAHVTVNGINLQRVAARPAGA